MTTTLDERAFAAEYERVTTDARGWASGWLLDLKAAAMAEFRERGYPTARDEEWRFTPIAPIVETQFAAADGGGAVTSASAEEGAWPTVTLSGGAVHLPDNARVPDGVTVRRLRDLAADPPAWLAGALGHTAPFHRHPFSALNTALFADAVVIHVGDGVVVDAPIAIRHVAPGSGSDYPAAVHPRVLLVAGRSAQVALVERYVGAADDVYLVNAVTEVVAGPNADVTHYRVQDESAAAYHVGMLGVRLARDARYRNVSVALGAAISRVDIQAVLADEGAECTLDGLYVADGRRLVDTHTFVDHARPNGASHELYKGVLNGQARGVFNGKILVRQDAQKTDAKQTNQALLLSDEAQVHTKPQLEIFADDVKCTHGATVGQLDRDALFYLRQRGISASDARNLLIHAFAGDIVDRIELEPLRDEIAQKLTRLGV